MLELNQLDAHILTYRFHCLLLAAFMRFGSAIS